MSHSNIADKDQPYVIIEDRKDPEMITSVGLLSNRVINAQQHIKPRP